MEPTVLVVIAKLFICSASSCDTGIWDKDSMVFANKEDCYVYVAKQLSRKNGTDGMCFYYPLPEDLVPTKVKRTLEQSPLDPSLDAYKESGWHLGSKTVPIEEELKTLEDRIYPERQNVSPSQILELESNNE